MRLEDLMDRASQYDETLARDIKDYVHGRKYGLVYEASKPEFVRMWKKPVVRGDLVNILPPRGVMEDTKKDDDSAEIVYKVISITAGIAKLRNTETGEDKEAAVDDVVAVARFDRPIYAGLKEVDRVERGGDKPYHVVINGENYHVLQTLVYAYQGMVDCIYIDPPYNTGASDWKYNNNYVGKDDQYRHSKWLTFMEDRLKLAKKLLSKTGILVVTIDDNEYNRLSILIEQLFPDYIQDTICVQMNPGGTQGDAISVTNEFMIMVYTKESEIYRKPHKGGDTYNLRRWGSTSTRYEGATCFYPIFVDKDDNIVGFGDVLPDDIHPTAQVEQNSEGLYVVWPIDIKGVERKWRYARNTVESVRDRMFVVHNGNRIELLLHRESEPMKTMWVDDAYNSESYGTKMLKSIIGKDKFSYPKSLYAVRDTLFHCTSGKPNALIVDFFAGSGTTLHAVNLLNAEDGGSRRCICVTNNEVSADEIKSLTKMLLRPGDDDWDKFGIARYVTWPRVKCAIEGVDVNGNPLKGDYGCSTETYEAYEGDVLDPETGKKKRKTLYEKVKTPSYPELADHMMADGFEENAIFFDIEYLEPAVVGADLAYESIAPILWMCGGCKGEILERHKGYAIGETYAVLFDPRYTKKFVDVVLDKPEVNTVFIVTDAAERYRSLCAELPGRRVMQLYESYLRSFEINAIG